MADVYDPVETKPWDEVVADHERRVLDQLSYLERESDFYRRRFDEWDVDVDAIRSLEAFREIPFTTKQDERDCQQDVTPDRPLGDHQAVPTERLNRTISSSGTTGKPTYFGLTRSDREDWNTVLTRCFYTAGVRPEDTVLFGVGQTMITGGTPYFEGLTELGANVVPAGGEGTERLLSVADDLYPDVLWTTTSHLRYLADRIEEVTGKTPAEFSMHKLVGGAAPGIANPEIRGGLYETYDATLVREIMGLGDVLGCIWAECEAESGMHFHGHEHVHVELVEPESGERVEMESGAEGELVYTPLGREATPLLRFRSGDYARVAGTDCPCGRTAPRIQLLGRADDMLIYKAQNVYPAGIREVVGTVEGATPRMKVVLPRADTVQFDDPIPIEVVRDADTHRTDEEIVDDIREAVREQLLVRVDPTLVPRDAVELSTYKTDLVRVRGEDGGG